MILVALGAIIVGLVVLALWPRPVPVETAAVVRGTLRVTVDEDGRTRIKEKYVVSAPLAGRLARATLKEGDTVDAGATVLAAIEPADPSLLDPRAEAEARARISAAEAALDRAEAELARVTAAMELAQNDLTRARDAVARQAASPQELDEAAAKELMQRQEVRSAGFARDIARFELEQARAAMLRSTSEEAAGAWRFEILAPVNGRVLRVFKESADVVQPGTPLIEIGEPTDLEVVVDVLSSDGVKIRPGAAATIEHWGGEQPLQARVRLVEPSAFTKVSALGVEEQRVNVVLDFADPPAARSGLGDAFRVEARIVTAELNDVLTTPTGALFRHADSWAVFVVADGRATMRDVQVGQRTGDAAQIVSGLDDGDRVIVYPSDRVQVGTRVRSARE
jgi:HlyD family secretion protein